MYSPWANLTEMIEASQATTPFALQTFQNSDLGEPFVPPGGGIAIDVLDRCRRDYRLDEYAGQPCVMGVDVGIRLHVVIRERRDRARERTHSAAEQAAFKPRLWFTGEVSSFSDLDTLMERFNVKVCVIDAFPETHLAREFALRHRQNVWLAQYGRQQPGHERLRGGPGEPNLYHVNRVEALDAMFQQFRDGIAELPCDARGLGGRVKEGLGEYYRELLVPKRTLERDGQANWVAKWVDQGRDDHFAHAELCSMLAGEVPRGVRLAIRRF